MSEQQKLDFLNQLIAASSGDESEFKHFWGPTDVKYFGSTNRCISFHQPIDRDSAAVICSQLWELDFLSTDQITLILNTEGGDVDSSFAIYDCIKGLSSPVVIVATGLVASGGLIVLSAGDYRISTENCLFFYHQPIISGFEILSTDQMKSLDNLYSYYQVKMDDLLKAKTKMPKKDWTTFFEGTTSYYFSPEQALKYGFIDTINVPKKKKVKISKKEDKNDK